MKKIIYLIIIILMFSFGCVRQQNLKMSSACEQCVSQISNETKSAIKNGSTLVSEGSGKILEYLIQTEKLLSDKIEELKRSHPEKVAEAQAYLDSIRTKITEYKRGQWKELTNSLGI